VGKVRWNSTKLRLWNEVSTILLFAIVFLIVLKSTLSMVWGLAGLIALAILLMLGIKVYKNYRLKKGQ
jgi:protoporphyrinogen IX oxidase